MESSMYLDMMAKYKHARLEEAKRGGEVGIMRTRLAESNAEKQVALDLADVSMVKRNEAEEKALTMENKAISMEKKHSEIADNY